MSGGIQHHPDPLRHRRNRGGLLRACAALVTVLALALFSLPVLHAADAPDAWRPLERQWFDTVSMNDGLPQSITTALAMDRDGLLWIGTMGGLARYDGYRIQVFELADAAATGLPDTYVRSLLALPDGGLLVGTNDGGLTRFDPQTGRFRNYPVGPGGTSDRKIYAMSANGTQGVWIGTDRGLDYLDLHSDRISTIATGPQTSQRNFTVYQDRAGNLWLGNNNGLFVRYAGSNGFVRPAHPDGVIDQVLRDQIWAVREDAEGRLWVGSGQMGAVYLDRQGQWHTIPGFSGHSGITQQPTVRDLLEVSPNRIWIATDGNGILAWSPGDASTHVISHDTSLPSSLPGNTVRALLEHAGNVWAATDLGLARSNAAGAVAFPVLPGADPAHALGNPNVRSILIDSVGRVWLGMAAGEVDVIDLATATVRHLLLTGKQSRRDVQNLAEGPDGSIWVGTYGVAQIDPYTLAVRGTLLPELGDSPVLSLLRQGPYMLLGTYNGAYRYDTRSGQLVHYGHVAGHPESLASDTVRQIVRVGRSIWYATSNGISIARDPLQTSGFIHLEERAGDPDSLPQNSVYSIATDTRGRIWVGTPGGLAMLPHGSAPPYRFRRFGMNDGLASNKISAVQPDTAGNVWASTANGIFVVDGSNLRIRSLGIRDGLHISSYVYAAAARMPDGTLLFGGLGGLTVIRPAWHEPDLPQAPLRITNALVNGRPLPFGQLPGDHGSLALSAHQRSLRLDFALLDYHELQETTYSYRMEGLDDDWIAVPKGNTPTAIYTNLPYGHYVLHLRAVPHGLQAHTVESTLDISVAPLWYETVWVRLLAIVLLLGLIVLLVQLRTLYLRHRAKQLQAQIDVHTRELRAANQRLDLLVGTDELTGICNRRRFFELAEEVLRNAGTTPVSIALLDLDRFKLVNDKHGHLAGDEVLRTAAGVICQQLRSGDLVGRYGGEELVLCLPNNAGWQAMAITERIRTALRSTLIRHQGRAISITVSIGIAELKPGESMTAWLSRADAALYTSKHQGRNRCTLAG